MKPLHTGALGRSLALALFASLAAYCLVLGLATTHEELRLSRGLAMPAALWTFVAVLVGGVLYLMGHKPNERPH